MIVPLFTQGIINVPEWRRQSGIGRDVVHFFTWNPHRRYYDLVVPASHLPWLSAWLYGISNHMGFNPTLPINGDESQAARGWAREDFINNAVQAIRLAGSPSAQCYRNAAIANGLELRVEWGILVYDLLVSLLRQLSSKI